MYNIEALIKFIPVSYGTLEKVYRFMKMEGHGVHSIFNRVPCGSTLARMFPNSVGVETRRRSHVRCTFPSTSAFQPASTEQWSNKGFSCLLNSYSTSHTTTLRSFRICFLCCVISHILTPWGKAWQIACCGTVSYTHNSSNGRDSLYIHISKNGRHF